MADRPIKLYLMSFVLVLLAPLFGLVARKNPGAYETAKIRLGPEEFEFEIADTPKKQIRGLMFRESLERNKGMLFIFNQPTRAAFWMKNVKFPLDIIFLSEKGEIQEIWRNMQPCTICVAQMPEQKAKYVLEIKGGLSDHLNLSIGQKIPVPRQ